MNTWTFLCLLTVGSSAAAARPFSGPDTTRMQELISVLGHDSLEGRATGTAGGEKAARFLADQFSQSGLVPAGDHGSWFQKIPMHGSTPLPGCRLMVHTDDENRVLVQGQDYLLYQTGAQTFLPVPEELVFAGYGITAPQYDYNDYQSISVAGKIAVILAGEPRSEDPDWFSGSLPTTFSSAETKQRIALAQGALGCLIIQDPSDTYRNWEYYRRDFSFEQVTLAFFPAGNLSLLLNPKMAADLFDGSGYTFGDVLQMDRSGTMRSFPLRPRLSFSGEFRQRDFLSANVIGEADGKNPDLPVLVITAHYDHLGTGPAIRQDSIYNGVFDNALGVAVLAEIARLLSLPENQPDRTVVFLITTGEEKGLLGARYYTFHPRYPLYRTSAAVNIDGISVLDEVTSVLLPGADLSDLQTLIEPVLDRHNVTVSDAPGPVVLSESFYRSDHFAFASAGIPAVSILEGTDYLHLDRETAGYLKMEWDQTRYHTPLDDLSQAINWRAVRQHANLIYETVRQLASAGNEPEWKRNSPYNTIRLQHRAEKK